QPRAVPRQARDGRRRRPARRRDPRQGVLPAGGRRQRQGEPAPDPPAQPAPPQRPPLLRRPPLPACALSRRAGRPAQVWPPRLEWRGPSAQDPAPRNSLTIRRRFTGLCIALVQSRAPTGAAGCPIGRGGFSSPPPLAARALVAADRTACRLPAA